MASRDASITALWGPDHIEFEVVVSVAVGRQCVLALTRGKYPKGYLHVDPNEDAVGSVRYGQNWILAVVDGHEGFEAARAALTAVLATVSLSHHPPQALVLDLFKRARAAVAGAAANAQGSHLRSGTTLTVVLVADGRATSATLGDSAALLIDEAAVRRLGRPSGFLGPHTDLSDLFVETADVSSGDILILCTDGLSRFLGRGWKSRMGELTSEHEQPEALVAAAIGRAFEGGAGDNIAMAVLRV